MKAFGIKTALVGVLMMVGTANSAAQNWFMEHEDAPFGYNLSYVNKDWVTDFGRGDVYHENLWGEEGKKLHGFEIGVIYQPCTKPGFGFYTGLNMNLYVSVSDAIRDYSWGSDEFVEWGLYVPLHAMYRLPLGHDCSISVHGGIGVDLAIIGEFSRYADNFFDDYYDRPYDYLEYGRGEFPRHFNLSKEIAASLRIKDFQFTATFSKGITNHGFYSKDHKSTHQNKFGLTVTILDL